MKNDSKSIYLVLDPQMQKDLLMQRLASIIDKGISYIQIWDHFQQEQDIGEWIWDVHQLSSFHQIPLLINNRWELLMDYPLDGVHFNALPSNLSYIREKIQRAFIVGVTCSNDMSVIEQAARENLDYISFCSIFPSSSVGTCEIVQPESIRKARSVFKKNIFLSGGILPDNIAQLADLDYDGIAVISGLMNAKRPEFAMEEYKKELK